MHWIGKLAGTQIFKILTQWLTLQRPAVISIKYNKIIEYK